MPSSPSEEMVLAPPYSIRMLAWIAWGLLRWATEMLHERDRGEAGRSRPIEYAARSFPAPSEISPSELLSLGKPGSTTARVHPQRCAPSWKAHERRAPPR